MNPSIIIVPTDSIQQLCNSNRDIALFFNKFPYESVIELAVLLGNNRDFTDAIWHEITQRLTEDEIEIFDLENLDFFLETIIQSFYEDLRSIYPNTSDNFKVLHWLPDAVCLIRNKLNEIKLLTYDENVTSRLKWPFTKDGFGMYPPALF